MALELDKETYTAEEVRALTEGLEKNKNQILSEKKQFEEKATKFDEMSQQAIDAQNALKKAEEDKLRTAGEFETLANQKDQELETLRASVAQEKAAREQTVIDNFANTIAGEVSQGLSAQQIKDAAYFLKENIQLNDQGQPVFMQAGMVVDNETMKKNFSESRPYLVAGPQSTGGGAVQTRSGGGAKAFKDMNQTEKTQLANEDPIKYKQLAGI